MSNPFHLVQEFTNGIFRNYCMQVGLETGILDAVSRGGSRGLSIDVLSKKLNLDPCRLEQGVVLLQQQGVLGEDAYSLSFTPRFEMTYEFRDLLEVQVRYAIQVMGNMAAFGSLPLTDPGKHATSLIGFFEYNTSHVFSEEELESMASWVNYMSTLTRYHAPFLIKLLEMDSVNKVVDVAGNNGQLSRSLATAFKHLSFRVLDLPIVCEIGRRKTAEAGLTERIGFHPVNLLEFEDYPEDGDLYIFKSFLHDLGIEPVISILQRVYNRMEMGKEIVVFECAEMNGDNYVFDDHDLVTFPFLHCLRTQEEYIALLERIGFKVEIVEFLSELHFFFIRARKVGRNG